MGKGRRGKRGGEGRTAEIMGFRHWVRAVRQDWKERMCSRRAWAVRAGSGGLLF